MGRLDGKTAVITGSGRGIGAIMAQHMAKEGANVVVTDVLDTSDTVAAITDGGGAALGLNVDVTSDSDLAAMVEATEKEFVCYQNVPHADVSWHRPVAPRHPRFTV